MGTLYLDHEVRQGGGYWVRFVREETQGRHDLTRWFIVMSTRELIALAAKEGAALREVTQ